MANITLNTLVYTGQGLLNGIASWFNMASGIASSFNKLTAKVQLPQSSTDPYATVKWKLEMPFVKTDPAACPCPGELPYTATLVTINARFDYRIPQAQRDATLQSIKDLVTKAEFAASYSSLSQPAG